MNIKKMKEMEEIKKTHMDITIVQHQIYNIGRMYWVDQNPSMNVIAHDHLRTLSPDDFIGA